MKCLCVIKDFKTGNTGFLQTLHFAELSPGEALGEEFLKLPVS